MARHSGSAVDMAAAAPKDVTHDDRAPGDGRVNGTDRGDGMANALTNRQAAVGVLAGPAFGPGYLLGEPLSFGEFIQFRLPTGGRTRRDLIHAALLSRTSRADVPTRERLGQTDTACSSTTGERVRLGPVRELPNRGSGV
jgi:hypothetical protein